MGKPIKGIRFKSWATVVVSIFLLCFLSNCATAVTKLAKPVTGPTNFPAYESLKRSYTIANFRIGGKYDMANPASYELGGQGGVTLESLGYGPLKVSYIAVGTPEKNSKGEITNAVIINSYYSGDSTSMYFFWHDHGGKRVLTSKPLVGPDLLIDTNRFYVIYLDALGLWGTSKPSEGLGMKFPKYNNFDLVQANYRLLKDHLKVAKIKLATGVSMGATQSYIWAVLHPEFVEAIMPVGGTAQADPFNAWLFTLMTSALQSDPVWMETEGDYYHLSKDKHPNQGVMFGWSMLAHTGFDFSFAVTLPWKAVEPKIFLWDADPKSLGWCWSKAKAYDCNDLIFRNTAGEDFDIRPHLPKIKAKTLVIHVKNDQWLAYSLAEKSAKAIPGGKISSFRHKLAHYAVFDAPNINQYDVETFFQTIGLKEKPVTGSANFPQYGNLKKSYSIPNFKIGGKYEFGNLSSYEFGGQGGVSLESLGAGPLRASYIAVGTPERNDKGEITNAVLINSYYSGDSTSMYFFWYDHGGKRVLTKKPVVGPGLLIDTDKYYVIFLDALGLWGTSKPSEGLGMKFPKYNNFDLVQANYRLLKDHLKVARVKLATGVSMGATQSYIWAVLHPEFVEAIMPVGGTAQADPFNAWLFTLMTSALQSDPVWMKTEGDYYGLPKEKHPNQGVMFGWSMLAHTGFDFSFAVKLPWKAVAPKIFRWDMDPKSLGWCWSKAEAYDCNDLIFRNTAGEDFDIRPHLPKIKAKTLVIHVKNDQWLAYSLAEKSAKAIPCARITGFKHNLAHYAVFNAPNLVDDEIKLFFEDAGMPDHGKTYCLDKSSYQSPKIIMERKPGQSHWKDQVIYPFDVKYATCKDTRGIKWEIAYMDEYVGTDPNPPVLVIIHGKGANAGHYGYTMKYALMKGLRVIAVDMPHYGKSSPGNTKKSEARTLDDFRALTHDLVVEQLGVKKAFYHGHSLGGQVVLGYALLYPDAVAGLVLEAPAGIEPIPGEHGDLVDPSYGYDFKKWKEIWGPVGVLDKELKKTPEDIQLSYYFKKKDPDTGKVVPAKAGYFKRNTEYAQLLTDQRIAIIDLNPDDGWDEEYWHHIVAFVFDIYSMVSESRKGDPKGLFNNLEKIKCPIFLQFGAEEPFIPVTAISGLTDREEEIVRPFMARMQKVDNPVTYKSYPGAGHFIHTDSPYEYARDCVDFILTGKVKGAETGTMAVAEEAAAPAKSKKTKEKKKGAFSK